MSRSRTFLAVGITLYMLSTLLHYFGPETGALAFMEGLLSGMAVVFSMVGLFFFGKLKRSYFYTSDNEKVNQKG